MDVWNWIFVLLGAFTVGGVIALAVTGESLRMLYPVWKGLWWLFFGKPVQPPNAWRAAALEAVSQRDDGLWVIAGDSWEHTDRQLTLAVAETLLRDGLRDRVPATRKVVSREHGPIELPESSFDMMVALNDRRIKTAVLLPQPQTRPVHASHTTLRESAPPKCIKCERYATPGSRWYCSAHNQTQELVDYAPPVATPSGNSVADSMPPFELSDNDRALLRIMSGATFGPNASVTLPSGRTVSGAEMTRLLEEVERAEAPDSLT